MMKIVVPIPVFGRFPLLIQTIKRLYERNKVYKVICIGHEPEAEWIAKSLGAEWIYHANSPLGAKWNTGFQACKKYDPDGVLFAGSSDWFSDNYITDGAEYLSEFDLIGMLGCHFADIADTVRVVHWEGYKDKTRLGEPIGIGRILSAQLLTRINWTPFEDHLVNSMDWSMWQKTKHSKIKLLDNTFKTMSISTNKWVNKHKFADHYTGGILESTIVDNNVLKDFPEIYLI